MPDFDLTVEMSVLLMRPLAVTSFRKFDPVVTSPEWDFTEAISVELTARFGGVSVMSPMSMSIETATFPNWDGTEQKRAFTVTGDELTYTIPAASGGGTATTVWKRAK